MMFNLYNKMGQPIKYRGQLNKGDSVRVGPGGMKHKVTELEGNKGIMRSIYGTNYILKYTEERGWIWK